MAHSRSNSGGAVGLALLGGLGLLAYGAHTHQRRQQLHAFVLGQLRRASTLIGVEVPPLLASNSIPNAASDGQRVLYSPAWVEGVMARYCADGTCRTALVLATMAHEVAHHVNEDALRRDLHPHQKELRADYVAGAVLARAELEVCDFERLLDDLSRHCTHTHPGREDRVFALRRGFTDHAFTL